VAKNIDFACCTRGKHSTPCGIHENIERFGKNLVALNFFG
jgi:hypothetical protein